MSSLSGKVAIVGGSSEGIGYGIATRLAADGADVALVARRPDKLEAAAEGLRRETGRHVFTVAADIRKAADCERIVAEPLQHFGRVDILVNNDGAPPLGDLMSFGDDAWEKAWQQNFMSVVRLTRGVVPAMRQAGGGRIVNITALSALQPVPKFGLSVATWAAVIGYAKTLSLEVARDGITVNTVCPGRFATARLAKVFGEAGEDAENLRARLNADVPVGRIGKVSEIAALVAMLVSEEGAYITGSTMHMDGGRRSSLL